MTFDIFLSVDIFLSIYYLKGISNARIDCKIFIAVVDILPRRREFQRSNVGLSIHMINMAYQY